MAVLKSFGAYVPNRVVPNSELAARLNRTPQWILDVSGIEERRYAEPDETVADMAVQAAERCLERAGLTAADIGLFIVASGSSERRFPGPAAAVAHRLGTAPRPALDVPMASAGSLFGMAMGRTLTESYGHILVIAAEKLSTIMLREPAVEGVAMLFGDGAGACVISPGDGPNKLVDSLLCSDGTYADDLRLELNGAFCMNGRSVIMQASRKIPAAISEVLTRNRVAASEIAIFLMHQANQNLINGVARSLQVDASKFYSNIHKYGNTSSASMLIAASEWWDNAKHFAGQHICFAGFGAGFHWGALLAQC